MEIKRVVEYQDDTLNVRLAIGPGTALARMRRAVYSGRAMRFLDGMDKQTGVQANAMRITASVLYPDLLGAVVEAEGLDLDELSVAQFMELPDTLVTQWENATYEAIPHWAPMFGEDEAQEEAAEKKGSSSETSASP